MRKNVLKNFHYKEADDFAAYLHDMSLKGWHFAEWRRGLVFEKGEPQDIEYSVEVFQRGSEMDTRPEPDAVEFAGYCEAAGWEFVDSRRKFCIFRKKSADAVPIVTPEERFENIRKAELRCWCEAFVLAVMLMGLYWTQFLTVNFGRWIFSNIFLVCMGLVTLIFSVRVLQGIGLALWCIRRKRQIVQNRQIYYGYGKKTAVLLHLCRALAPIVLLCMLLIAAFSEGRYREAATVIVGLLVIGAVFILIAEMRPSREENWMIQISAGIAVPVLILVVTLVSISGDWKNSRGVQESGENLPEGNIPLTRDDFEETSGGISYADVGNQENFLGAMQYCYTRYAGDGKSNGGSDLQYEIYESGFHWILDRIWKERLEDCENAEDCSKIWGTEQAVVDTTYFDSCRYFVRNDDKLFIMITDDTLNGEQIQAIKEKIGI